MVHVTVWPETVHVQPEPVAGVAVVGVNPLGKVSVKVALSCSEVPDDRSDPAKMNDAPLPAIRPPVFAREKSGWLMKSAALAEAASVDDTKAVFVTAPNEAETDTAIVIGAN